MDLWYSTRMDTNFFHTIEVQESWWHRFSRYQGPWGSPHRHKVICRFTGEARSVLVRRGYRTSRWEFKRRIGGGTMPGFTPGSW